ISKADLLGKYYLMDFWFTGCAICLKEMPHLHDLYEKYKDKNFTILSLSIDESADLVKRFQQKKWAMPWLNAHLKESWESPLLKEFEFKGSPTLYLISPEGKVLAGNDQLLGESLGQTLAKHLK
ncbi:TlpA family protein disulfide reductase, partial [bacterium]|nr:TlpA family protein disulfide reductase [bacterium]